jgi:hypothetical protein
MFFRLSIPLVEIESKCCRKENLPGCETKYIGRIVLSAARVLISVSDASLLIIIERSCEGDFCLAIM